MSEQGTTFEVHSNINDAAAASIESEQSWCPFPAAVQDQQADVKICLHASLHARVLAASGRPGWPAQRYCPQMLLLRMLRFQHPHLTQIWHPVHDVCDALEQLMLLYTATHPSTVVRYRPGSRRAVDKLYRISEPR